MDFSTLTQYFVLVVVVGYIIKKATIFKWIPNNDIPGILTVLGGGGQYLCRKTK